MSSLNYLQQYSYNVLMAGYNVFLTGDAGTGKTFVINRFVSDSRRKGRNVMVVAPTGIAALHIDGVTIHHQFGAKTGPIIKCATDDSKLAELVNTDILIIEEISMCRIDLFDFVINYVLEANNIRKRYNKPNIQMVVCGDFLQLPPVITEKDREILEVKYKGQLVSGFAFESIYWNKFDFKIIILNEIVRQDNKEFVIHLNKLRVGDKSAIQYIIDNSSKFKMNDAINLYGKNNEAIEKNIEELNRINEELYQHDATLTGAAKITDCNAEEHLLLKVGARVMSLVNHELEDGTIVYGNGSLGTVVAINDNYVTVEFDNGAIENIGEYTWDVFRYTIEDKGERPKLIIDKIGDVTQIPLKLAYAVTIHKAQGQTYDSVNISPYAWDCGQLYVALSRVRNIQNLYLNYTIDPRYLVVSLNVIKFYNSIVNKANLDVDTSKCLLDKKQEYEDEDLNTLLGLLGG